MKLQNELEDLKMNDAEKKRHRPGLLPWLEEVQKKIQRLQEKIDEPVREQKRLEKEKAKEEENLRKKEERRQKTIERQEEQRKADLANKERWKKIKEDSKLWKQRPLNMSRSRMPGPSDKEWQEKARIKRLEEDEEPRKKRIQEAIEILKTMPVPEGIIPTKK